MARDAVRTYKVQTESKIQYYVTVKGKTLTVADAWDVVRSVPVMPYPGRSLVVDLSRKSDITAIFLAALFRLCFERRNVDRLTVLHSAGGEFGSMVDEADRLNKVSHRTKILLKEG